MKQKKISLSTNLGIGSVIVPPQDDPDKHPNAPDPTPPVIASEAKQSLTLRAPQ